MLSEADMADKQALGARADLFAAHKSNQAHDMLAAVSPFPVQSGGSAPQSQQQPVPPPLAC
jgi:hypothetical protein